MLLKNVRFLSGDAGDVRINGNRFGAIGGIQQPQPGEEVIDAQGMLIIPPFYNCHTHSVMTLLRGYADDLQLMPWLQEHIWPAEAKLTLEDYEIGTRLAILEMIKSGTVFFNDSYFEPSIRARIVEEMGVRAVIGQLLLQSTPEALARMEANNERFLAEYKAQKYSSRIQVSYQPHAIYTVDEAHLRCYAEKAKEDQLFFDMHLAETQGEFEECKKAHKGLTPVEYMAEIGALNERSSFSHGVWLTDHDIELLAESRALVCVNPTSNMKLVSGMFRFNDMQKAGVRVALGTDGCASNNSHSMFSEMKVCALLAKIQANDPTAGSAEQVFHAATSSGAQTFVPDGGRIEMGALADALLIRTDQDYFVADHHWISNLVYAGESSCVDTMICDGKILMRGHHVDGEEEIREAARRACRHLR